MAAEGTFDYQTLRDVLTRRFGATAVEAAELEATLLTERAAHAAERQELLDQIARHQPTADTAPAAEPPVSPAEA